MNDWYDEHNDLHTEQELNQEQPQESGMDANTVPAPIESKEAEPWLVQPVESLAPEPVPTPSPVSVFDGMEPQPVQPQAQAVAPPAMPVVTVVKNEKNEKKKSHFKRNAAVACLVAVLGGGTLGAGFSLGQGLSHYIFTPVAQATTPAAQAAFVNNSQQTSSVALTYSKSDVASIVSKVSNSVVSINVMATAQTFFGQSVDQPAAGSGIIFKEDADKVYVATNNHVIDGAKTVSISEDDNTQIPAAYVGSDSSSDLAVISVLKSDLQKNNVSYSIATFGDSSTIQVGDEVVAIGNAMGEGKTATSGIISAKAKSIDTDAGTKLTVIQTDAAINPGNSGGALADINGDVIGINTAKLSATGVEGMGYAIPINDAKTILEGLIVNGTVPKPYLGIAGVTITAEMQNMYSLPAVGVYVQDVTAGTGADKAGLSAGDLIVGYNDTKITSMDDLSAALAKSKVGDTVKLYIYANSSSPTTVTVTLGDMNAAKF